MSKLADRALEKIDNLEQALSEAKAARSERDAQLMQAVKALEEIRQQAASSHFDAIETITATALSSLSAPLHSLEQLTAKIRRETALECVSLIYPDGNPEIAIRRIKQDFRLFDAT